MPADRAVINIDEIDYTDLVGNPVQMKADQFPGKILTTRVVGVSGDKLLMDRSGSSGLVADLIHNQDVEVYLSYKGEPVVFSSKISIPHKGKLQIPLADSIFPVINREFQRVDMEKEVKLACFEAANISQVRLNRLRWFKTKTINISAGGLLVELPVNLSGDYYMIVHLGLSNVPIPDLIVGRVCHCRPGRESYFNAGIEFIVKEKHLEALPRSLIRNLPDKLFDFSEKSRDELNGFLIEKFTNNTIEE